MQTGKIIKLISNDYTVLSNQKEYICKSRGKFRKDQISPVVGDNVIFDEKNCYILEIEPRKNKLVRPPIANVDQAFIITSVKQPDFSSYLLDKLIILIEYHHIEPIICFTKLDLLNKKELEQIKKIINYYKKIGYTVYQNTQIDEIKKSFRHKISVFTGQTGAGKSTLINHIDPNLKIKTGEISKALGRGRHTTRHVELIFLNKGLVADTPGFSSIDLIEMENRDIRDGFIEFELYKQKCKYRDCMHDKEDVCEVKNKVEQKEILLSRYENYLSFIHNKNTR